MFANSLKYFLKCSNIKSRNFRTCVRIKEHGRDTYMDTKEIRKNLHEVIDKLNDGQIVKLYQLIKGIFGKAI